MFVCLYMDTGMCGWFLHPGGGDELREGEGTPQRVGPEPVLWDPLCSQRKIPSK